LEMRCVIILLCLSISGCSWFSKTPALDVNYELKKEDRAKPNHIQCDCNDPDKLSLLPPEIKKKEKGFVTLSNSDYEVLADNEQGRIKWHKDGRSYKKCILRCLVKYNLYLNEFY